ncbi:MAG TPA: SMP-30/gluconolactonase/LRE family protein [Acidobacteriota bacterium]
MKISNYSLNYSRLLAQRKMDVFRFLGLCRELGVEGASLHIRDLESTQPDYLKKIRRAYLDHGLSVSMFTVTTDFGKPDPAQEFEKAREAIRVALFLGAPLLRVFAGSPFSEQERNQAFERAALAIRGVCQEAAEAGLPVGLQNHNHRALCRTGDEVLRFIRIVDHSNLCFVLDTGQFAGSKGASGQVPADLQSADPMESIRQTASLARYVRAKFYNPGPDGSEPSINYDKVLDILRGVHYQGFIDIVYEGPAGTGEDVRRAVPLIVSFLRSKIALGPSPQLAAQTTARPRYAGLATTSYLPDGEIRTETQVAFLEGPAVDRSGNVFFSNIEAEQILKWDPAGKKLTVFRQNSNKANGLRFDRRGRLLACEGGGRVIRINVQTGEITVLADKYQGKPLGAPNDLATDGNGRIYFTSRLANRDPKTGNVNAVYRIDPDGAITRILAWPAIDMPNGIVTSADDKILYLIDSDSGENRARRIRAYDLQPDGTVTNERLLYDFYPGRGGDGMAVDREGNLYVAAGLHRRRGTSETLDTLPGVHVISPEGKLLAFVETPEDTITNCTFGGADLRTLYVTCGKGLFSLRTRIPGKPAYRPEA